MDLSTTYMGFLLPHPLMPGSSPLCGNLDLVRRLEDAGAAALVMPTLFEEADFEEQPAAAALGLPRGPDEYLELIQGIQSEVEIPVFASLHGVNPGWWRSYSRLVEQAGADGIELNVDEVATDPSLGSEELERRMLAVVSAVKASVKIPVAVKLASVHSALANLAQRLDGAGADGLVLFNRFYQADIDLERLEVVRSLSSSGPPELLERLRWLAVISGQVEASLAASGGVHRPIDALKAVMAGAHAVQLVSALVEHGPGDLRALVDGMSAWMQDNGYQSLSRIQGSLSLRYCPDPRALERANYAPVDQSLVVEGF